MSYDNTGGWFRAIVPIDNPIGDWFPSHRYRCGYLFIFIYRQVSVVEAVAVVGKMRASPEDENKSQRAVRRNDVLANAQTFPPAAPCLDALMLIFKLIVSPTNALKRAVFSTETFKLPTGMRASCLYPFLWLPHSLPHAFCPTPPRTLLLPTLTRLYCPRMAVSAVRDRAASC